MKKILFITIPLLALPIITFAFGLNIPFGGRVMTTHIPPNVVCYGDLTASPFTQNTVGVTPPAMNWSKMYGQYNVGIILPSAWMLGFYTISSDCVQVDGPEAHPYPTLQTNFYGTSIRKPVPVPFL